MGISTSMDPSSETNLVPDARIYQRVRNEIRHAKSGQNKIPRVVLQPMFGVFKLRIPLYQALLGVGVTLLVSIMMEKVNFSDVELSRRTQTRESAIIESEVLDHLKMIDRQEIGRAVAEGSFSVQPIVGVRDAFLTESGS